MSSIIERMYSGDQEMPPRLYHYTSQQGLIGILSSHTLWSTRIQYLNDSTKFQYTLGLLKNSIYARRELIKAKTSMDSAGGPRFEEILNFRVAHSSRFSKGGWFLI
jgi:hypothetical protein